jgi:anthranilate/para-aminobenzoate synthase component I
MTRTDDEGAEDEVDDWDKVEEEEEWDPDFDEFDIPKSKVKKAGTAKKGTAGKGEEEEEFGFGDDEFKDMDLFNDSEEEEDDFLKRVRLLNRLYTSFPITNFYTFKLQMLNWSTRFNICCFLDNHNYQISPHSYECILAAGALQFIEAKSGDAFNQLKAFSDAQPDWLFGHFSYDLKNEIEQLRSERPDHIQFPDLFFFVPRIIVRLDADRVTIGVIDEDASQILHSILSTPATFAEPDADALIAVKQRFSHEHYVNVIEKLKSHIHRGDCYEINFCQEFSRTVWTLIR